MNCCVERMKMRQDLCLHRDLLLLKYLFLVNRLPYTSFSMMAST
jgi:hypothetical protein